MTNDNNPDTDDLDGLYQSEFWSISRHELIASVAEERVSDHTRDQIRRVVKPLTDLGMPDSLTDLAAWADLVKNRGPQDDDDPDTVEFLEDERNANRSIWHFVNLPLDADEYSREKYPTMTSEEDVVQMINKSLRVLRGDNGGAEPRFSKLNALRLLVHLVGDVHQPVHVGCGYIDRSGPVARIERDPAVVVSHHLRSDRGGNDLILPIGSHGMNLHSYWDSKLGGANPDLGDAFDGSLSDPETEAVKQMQISKLREIVAQDPVPENGGGESDFGEMEEWAVEWANESLAAARSAYQSLEIVGPNGDDFDVSWEGKPAYEQRCKPIALTRLKDSVRDLAAMLDAIWA